MKTKWTILMLASGALALLMAVTPPVKSDDRPLPATLPGSTAPWAAEFRGSDGDVRHTASLEGCDCRQIRCQPYCAARAVTSHGDHFEIGFD